MSILVLITGEGEAAPLLRWGYRFAQAKKTSLEIIAARSGRDETDESINWQEKADQIGNNPSPQKDSTLDPLARAVVNALADIHRPTDTDDRSHHPDYSDIQTTLRWRVHPQPYQQIQTDVEKDLPHLLLLAKHLAANETDGHAELYENVHCATLMVRLGEHDGTAPERILIPAAGGTHSLAALRHFKGLLQHSAIILQPLYVARTTGEIATDVGRSILQKILRKVDLHDHPQVQPKVILAKDFQRGLQLAAEDNPDLIIIGQSSGNRVRRTLFGTISDAQTRGDHATAATAIGVFKSAKPIRQRLAARAEGLITDIVPQLTRDARIDLFARLETQSRWSFDFVSLLSLSTLIAGLGLVTNSAAVVIGAMLVAPLMVPILGAGLALMQGNAPLMRQSMKSVGFGFLAAFFIGVLIGLLVPIPDHLTSELNARGNPSVVDILIALASGVAAAYAMGRPDLSAALPGVAIAAALVPPIATSGIAFAEGVWHVAAGSSLLFATNVITIILSAALTLYLTGVRMKKTATWSLAILGLLTALTILLALTLGAPEFANPGEPHSHP